MSSRERNEDIATLLYMVPFAVSGVYGLAVWFQQGISAILPSRVYLAVTQSPEVFVIGSLAVLAGVVMEIHETDATQRRAMVGSLGTTLQTIAVASVFFALVGTFYSNGANVAAAVGDFMGGKYNLIFPAIMILMSYLITVPLRFSALAKSKTLGLVLLLLVPVAIYEVGKRQIYVGLGLAFALLIIGIMTYILPEREKGAEEALARAT
ncbi:MAG: hypothetical protein JRN56_06410 [Nitrososphaerota archaeon]|nr:hypothetical protein [Nitrososphaerota archaeon]MDG6912611.1 hypothetical protein [Nitrososphaerota archaeon]MDG6937122.1 hypothetical protein [Nitrososphaerota archaeon]MDG6962445.1 hypothetical protein [Nitrososphaerota archaeon]MDG6969833.1 hypothetical protein [Nitrososphaerota archaeon]